MKLSNIIETVKSTHWTQINNFYINIQFVPNGNNSGPIKFSKMCGWDSITMEELNASLISVNTPQFQNALVSQYVQYEWRFAQGRDQLYRFSMTFRDFDQMKLYDIFKTLYLKGKQQYYDNIKMNIQIIADKDIGIANAMPIYQTSTAIIESVSQLQFSHNTENQIAEFSVNFISNTLEPSV